jgi:geranylgeranyl reductase family protein
LAEQEYDVLIVGAGPAGAACAIQLAQSNLSVCIVDKSLFPRDKICGDAISIDVASQLVKLTGGLYESFLKHKHKVTSYGIRLYAPDRSHIDIPIASDGYPGYVCQRVDFDNILVEQVRAIPNVKMIENCDVESLVIDPEGASVKTNQGSIRAKLVIGADGAHSVIAKSIGGTRPQRKHYSAGLRIYYENVSFPAPRNLIELHFFNELLPGYLWIFPLPDNKANVGLGMLSSTVAERKLNIKKILDELIHQDPKLQQRFKDAKRLENVKGYGLPLGSKKRSLSGNRLLLVGDAASLIDPVTGEGIANAIRSGRVAGDHTIRCFLANDFSASFNRKYDQEIYRRLGAELRLSTQLQRLCRYPWLLNLIVKKANRNAAFMQLLADGLTKTGKKNSLVTPGFYYRLFFNR